jgi:hypothetical protein
VGYVVGGFIADAACIALIWLFVRLRIRKTKVRGVVPLLRATGKPVHFRTTILDFSTGVWNPARPDRLGYGIYALGRGTYWLDDDDLVHLDWRPRKGPARSFVTAHPVPPAAQRASSDRPDHSRREVLTVAVTYLFGVVAGFLIADWLSTGSSSHRAAVGLFGGLVGFVGAYGALLAFTHAFLRTRPERPPEATT